MAFFKFRKGADESGKAPAQAQTVESIRQRAKYRLAGATLLVLAGVIGLPLLFDKQPRPIAVDTPISIPDKSKVLPLVIPANPAPANPAVTPAPSVEKAPVAAPAEEILVDTKPAPAPAEKVMAGKNASPKETAVVAKPEASATPPKPVAKPANSQPDASRAQALLDGKAAAPKSTEAAAKGSKLAETKTAEAKAAEAKPATAPEGRFVVQIGAFAENDRAHEVRLKLEHAGLKTYAQNADTKDGRRIRVRVGPFSTRAEAEKVAEKIKKLNLPAALLTL
jgi:DedD protein